MVKEVTGRVQIGTRVLGQPASGTSAVPPQGMTSQPYGVTSTADGTDATLLAVVPIPGTGTSLAIVGYPVTTPGTTPRGEQPDTSGGKEFPGLLLDHDQRRVWVNGKEIELTFQEFELLAYLSARPSTVFSRAELVRHAWQRDFSADSRTVDVHVSRLRHKLGPVYGRCLVTEYRVGYQFRPPN